MGPLYDNPRFAAERHRYRRRMLEWSGEISNDDRRDNQRSPLPDPCLRELRVGAHPTHLTRRIQGYWNAVSRRLDTGLLGGPTGEEALRLAVTIHYLEALLNELSEDRVEMPAHWMQWLDDYRLGLR